MPLKQLKYILIFLLPFLSGAQTLYAKTELAPPENNPSFSFEQTANFTKEDYDEPLELDPFELVIFVNDSKYKKISDAISGSEITDKKFLVPALFLEYTDQKKFNEDAQFAVEVGFDALTILTTGGTLLMVKNITRLRRVWLIFEVANSSTNILINYSGIKDDPKWKDILVAYNLVTLGLNLSELSYSAAKGLKTISNNLHKAKNLEGNLVESTDNFIDLFNKIDKSKLSGDEIALYNELADVGAIAKRRSGSVKVLADAVGILTLLIFIQLVRL